MAGVSGGGPIWLEQVPFITVGHCQRHLGNNGLGVEAAAKKGERYSRLPVRQVEFWAVLLENGRGDPVGSGFHVFCVGHMGGQRWCCNNPWTALFVDDWGLIKLLSLQPLQQVGNSSNLRILDGISVGSGHHDKVPQTGWLK